MKRLAFASAILAAALGSSAASAQATGTFSTPMTVTAVYSGAASITVSPMNFGNVSDMKNGQIHNAVATIV